MNAAIESPEQTESFAGTLDTRINARIFHVMSNAAPALNLRKVHESISMTETATPLGTIALDLPGSPRGTVSYYPETGRVGVALPDGSIDWPEDGAARDVDHAASIAASWYGARVWAWESAEVSESCECSCGCTEPATTTDDGDNDVCAACADYYTTEDGDTVCSREQTESDPCRHCGERIEWGRIQTGAPGVANWIEGQCKCREWRQTERGPSNWVLSEGAASESSS